MKTRCRALFIPALLFLNTIYTISYHAEPTSVDTSIHEVTQITNVTMVAGNIVLKGVMPRYTLVEVQASTDLKNWRGYWYIQPTATNRFEEVIPLLPPFHEHGAFFRLKELFTVHPTPLP